MRPVLVVSVLALLLCGSGAAQPNPGVNGEIAFERGGAIRAFDPRTGTTRDIAAGSRPAWSPSGEIAYVRGETIYASAADGANEHALTTGDAPAWSPDGTMLAFVRGQQLNVLDVAKATVEQLTAGANVVLPAWSPDGTRIAYGTGDGLAAIALDGTPPQPLPVGVPVDGGPAWSPDGRQIAFVGAANGQLFVADAAGTNARQVTYTLAGPTDGAQRPAWSPDGTLVAWAQGADVCAADLTGKVARLTRTQEAQPPATAAAPDWQSTAQQPYRPVAAPAGPNDSRSCDWSPGPRVAILPVNVSPQLVSLPATKQLVFVNHLQVPATVRLTLHGAHATIPPGGSFAFPTAPGEYDFTVTGYPDNVPRRGSIEVASAGQTAIDQHAAIRYGTRTVLTGLAAGPAGEPVTITAQPHGASKATRVAAIRPTSGRWRVSVAPRITTLYRVTYAGSTAERPLRVMPILRVSRGAGTIGVSLTPAAPLRGKAVYLFRVAGREWIQARSVRLAADGRAAFRGLAAGRYYVGFAGNAAYWATASEPFNVRR